MQDDIRKILKRLTVAQLKDIAKEYGVDVTDCTNKKSHINTLTASGLTAEQVNETLSKMEAKEFAELSEVHDDLERLADSRADSKDIGGEEGIHIERGIDQALMLRPLFFEVDSATEHAWNKMIMGDFPDALRLNMESRMQVMERVSTFHLYSTALSLRAAETLMREMKDLTGGVSSELKTALAEAKLAFLNGPPKRREQTLEEVERLTAKAIEAFSEKSVEAERELKEMLDEYASFGVRVGGAAEMLEIAATAKSSKDYGQYSLLMTEARRLAENEKKTRMRSFESAFEQVRSAIDAAKEAGVDTKEDEAQFKDARKAFRKSEFKRAMELLAAVEQAADKEHLKKVQEDSDAEEREMKEIIDSMRRAEPDLEEAAMYGMDVQEGLLFVRQARTALDHKDVIGASKYSRRVRKLTKSMEGDLRRMRAERDIVKHMEGAKCGECGKETLYSYPDGRTRCDECGHVFSTTGEDPSEAADSKKKPGMFKNLLGG